MTEQPTTAAQFSAAMQAWEQQHGIVLVNRYGLAQSAAERLQRAQAKTTTTRAARKRQRAQPRTAGKRKGAA